MNSTLRSVRNLPRYQEIIRVFIKHGFGFIFENLSTEMLRPFRSLFRSHTNEPETEDLAIHLRLALEELGPTFVKLGQLLSTRPDLLPARYIKELSKLQDTVPPVPWTSIESVIIEELGDTPENLFYNIDKTPIAAASLAQVHAAILLSGERVVVKVQRPHITKIIARDLDVLADLTERFQSTAFGQTYDLVGVTNEFSFTLWNELDYKREGHNADRFRNNFARESYVYFPKIYWELTTTRVLVLERIQGIKIDDIEAIDANGLDRHKLAENAARIIIKEILEDGFFHADPHPGNLVVMPGYVIGAMDFGMVGFLNDNDRLNLIRLYAATIDIDMDAFIDQLTTMGVLAPPVDRVALGRDVERILNQYAGVPLKEIRAADLHEMIETIMFRHHIHLPSNYWLLAKTLVLMEGVGLHLDPSFDIFGVSKPYISKLMLQLIFPNRHLGQKIIRRSKDWTDLFDKVPRSMLHFFSSFEQGDLFQLTIKDLNQILNQTDRLVTRLSISIMISAIIIGMAMLTPLFANGSLVQWLLLLGFIFAFILGVWFLISMLRHGK